MKPILGKQIIMLSLGIPIFLPIKCNRQLKCATDQQHKQSTGGNNFLGGHMTKISHPPQ